MTIFLELSHSYKHAKPTKTCLFCQILLIHMYKVKHMQPWFCSLIPMLELKSGFSLMSSVDPVLSSVIFCFSLVMTSLLNLYFFPVTSSFFLTASSFLWIFPLSFWLTFLTASSGYMVISCHLLCLFLSSFFFFAFH